MRLLVWVYEFVFMCESLPNVRERETDDALCQARGRGFERKDGACQRVRVSVRVCVCKRGA